MQTTADVPLHVEDPPLKIGKSTITTSIDSVPSFSGRTKKISELVHIVRDNKPPQNNTKDTLVSLKVGSAEDASLKQTFDNVPSVRSELELPEGSSPKKTTDGVPEGSGHEFSVIKGSPLKETDGVPEGSGHEFSYIIGSPLKETADEVPEGSGHEFSIIKGSPLKETADEVAEGSGHEFSVIKGSPLKETDGVPEGSGHEFSYIKGSPLKETADEVPEGSGHEFSIIKGSPLKETADEVAEGSGHEFSFIKGSPVKETADEVPEGSGHEFSFIKDSPLKEIADEVADGESKTELSHPQGDSKKDTSDEVSRSGRRGSEMSSPDAALKKTGNDLLAGMSKSELSHPQDASIKNTDDKPEGSKSEFSPSEELLLKEISGEASGGSRSELSLPGNVKVKDTLIEICEESESLSSLPEEVSLIENLNAGPEKFAGKGFRSEDHGDLLTRIWKTITTNSSVTTACNSPICRYIIFALLIIGVVCTCIFVPIYVHEVGNKEDSSDLSGNEDTLISGSPPSNGTIAPPTSYYEPTVFINGTALKLVAKSCGGTGNNFWAKNGKDIVADIMCKVSKDRYELLPTAEGYCTLQIKNFSNKDVGRYSYRHGFCREVDIDTTKEPIIGTVKWSCPQLLPSFEMTVIHFSKNVSFQAFLDGQPINVTDVGVTKIVGKNLHQSTITVDLNNINSSLEIYFWNQYGQVWKIHKGEVKPCPRKNGSETKDSSDVNWYVVVFPAAVIVMVAVFLVALYKNKKWRSACLGRQGDGSAQENNPPEVGTLDMDNFSTKEGHDASAADGGSDGDVRECLMV